MLYSGNDIILMKSRMSQLRYFTYHGNVTNHGKQVEISPESISFRKVKGRSIP
jgi:hypothetical protein